MRNETGTIIIGTLFILSFGMLSNFIVHNQAEPTVETAYGSWACTTDTQICPNGEIVGRTPPYCQFALCKN